MFKQIARHLGRRAGAENLDTENQRLTLRPLAWSSALGGSSFLTVISSPVCEYTLVSPWIYREVAPVLEGILSGGRNPG